MLRERFDSVGHTVAYRGDRVKWDTLIGLKVQEFARYLVGKADVFDLKSPAPVLERSDSTELRERILGLSAFEAGKLGLGKSTVHYLKKHARDRKPFKVYKKIADRLTFTRRQTRPIVKREQADLRQNQRSC